jgi:hypothetical protein
VAHPLPQLGSFFLFLEATDQITLSILQSYSLLKLTPKCSDSVPPSLLQIPSTISSNKVHHIHIMVDSTTRRSPRGASKQAPNSPNKSAVKRRCPTDAPKQSPSKRVRTNTHQKILESSRTPVDRVQRPTIPIQSHNAAAETQRSIEALDTGPVNQVLRNWPKTPNRVGPQGPTYIKPGYRGGSLLLREGLSPETNPTRGKTHGSWQLFVGRGKELFTYSPLGDDEIRLIVVEPSNPKQVGEDKIVVQLIHVKLDQLGLEELGPHRCSYEALSYTWGPGDQKHHIYVRENTTNLMTGQTYSSLSRRSCGSNRTCTPL